MRAGAQAPTRASAVHSNPCTLGDGKALADFADDLDVTTEFVVPVASRSALGAAPAVRGAPCGARPPTFDDADRFDGRAWALGPDRRHPHDRAIAGPAVYPIAAPATAPTGPNTTAPDKAPNAALPTRS